MRLINVCRVSFKVENVIITKFWKVVRNVNVMFLRKFKKAILCFQVEISFLVFFSVFFMYSLFYICTSDYH